MVPAWLTALSWTSLVVSLVIAVLIVIDERARPQKMWIMAIVWPLAALFGSVLVGWFYLRWGRGGTAGDGKPPFPVQVAKGALHCGSGCTLGDIVAETVLLASPGLAVIFGLGWLFGDKIFAAWVLDYLVAFLFGIAFQYFTIAPMRHLSPGAGLIAAIKADTLSLTAWQVGMYGFMAIAHFGIFGALLGIKLGAAMPEFWFMMQLAMLCGFATSYPVNWWLLRAGLKEAM